MKNRMKFFLYTSLILMLILAVSCAKDDEIPGEYYMRFKANGNSVEYTYQLGLIASFSQSENQYVGTISGMNDASSNFSLLLYDNVPITESVYSGYDVSVGGTVGVLFAHKEKESGAVFSSGVTADYDARVTLTEITETGVKGTFSGIVKATGHPDINISDGSFFVKRVLN